MRLNKQLHALHGYPVGIAVLAYIIENNDAAAKLDDVLGFFGEPAVNRMMCYLRQRTADQWRPISDEELRNLDALKRLESPSRKAQSRAVRRIEAAHNITVVIRREDDVFDDDDELVRLGHLAVGVRLVDGKILELW